MKTAGVTDDVDTLIADTLTREESGSTALPQGVAIPHCRTSAVAQPVIAFASLSEQVIFDGSQNPVDLVFLIAVPLDAKRAHLTILSTLARALINESFAASLRAAITPAQVEAIISASLDSQTAMRKNNAPSSPIRIAAISACLTGIAHTYMAADALTSAAKARGDASLLVETQGTSDNPVLSEKEIASADVVIFAADVGVRDHERFKGKRILECSPRQAIRDPNDTLSAAIALKNSSRNTTVRPHATHRVAATAYDLERKMRTLR